MLLPERHMNYVQWAYHLILFLLFLPFLFGNLSAIIIAFRYFSQRLGHRSKWPVARFYRGRTPRRR